MQNLNILAAEEGGHAPENPLGFVAVEFAMSLVVFGLLLFLTGSIVGVFASQDLLLFYVSFEAMLIPLYVLVGVWGGERRQAATVTFVIYTMAGSLLMLASVVAFGVTQGTFSLTESGTSDNVWIFLGFAVAFAVKAPLFPFHGWLPLAYREAPVEVGAGQRAGELDPIGQPVR